ncbi:2-polyprenyl-6-methoxyphenol hydroxylase-like FAD-dependent oxidoreductase [Actinokineospora auranticolor]|uniref:2-polyprenyl-6-methoxyphenol hydroxylase-like FAD-dependent oxidoreductase n=1 Tax=Actinokineospora auranticolor TaxID=155976 RepID=A0A2S6GPM7_9PSEU|nr:2-polyprenyl-6-methoxyphenol hydroxylase-like FAD-dependent oxidoreductase [Actinokineospora auranticolor]
MVVGGGIGGLAVAVALRARRWRVRVLERAPGVDEVGAGISLWPNAMRALRVIGLDELVRDVGVVESGGGVRDRDGRWLSRVDNAELVRRHGHPLVVSHRRDLVRVLADALPDGVVMPGCRVVDVHNGDRRVVVDYVAEHRGVEDSVEADVVIGADGVRSTVRGLCLPNAPEPRYTGHTAWRVVTDPLDEPLESAAVVWGRGARFGYTALPGNRVYCFAAASFDEPQGAVVGRPLDRFARWPDPIPRLLDAAPPTRVVQHDIYDLPPLRSFTQGRMALLGDAAHAMSPALGQGACQALEDAVVLADCLDHDPVPSALTRYDHRRRRRAQLVARRSARLSTVSHWSGPFGARTRDAVTRALPEFVTMASMARLLRWTPSRTWTETSQVPDA